MLSNNPCAYLHFVSVCDAFCLLESWDYGSVSWYFVGDSELKSFARHEISYFSHWCECDKISEKSKVKHTGFILSHRSRAQPIRAGSHGSRSVRRLSHYIRGQEAEDKHPCSSYPSLLFRVGMVLTILRVSLSTPVSHT